MEKVTAQSAPPTCFTDENLAQMKVGIQDTTNVLVWTPVLLNIITRMEAAEKIVESTPIQDESLHDAWLKSCGRSK